MKVPLLDLRGQHLALRAQLLEAVERVIDSQQFVLGPEVEALEREVAAYSGSRFAIGCASGSDALLLALMVIDLQPGGEVIQLHSRFLRLPVRLRDSAACRDLWTSTRKPTT